MGDVSWPVWAFFKSVSSLYIRAPSPEWTHIRGAPISMLENVRDVLQLRCQLIYGIDKIYDHLPVQERAGI